jgi:hypothetical protein
MFMRSVSVGAAVALTLKRRFWMPTGLDAMMATVCGAEGGFCKSEVVGGRAEDSKKLSMCRRKLVFPRYYGEMVPRKESRVAPR